MQTDTVQHTNKNDDSNLIHEVIVSKTHEVYSQQEVHGWPIFQSPIALSDMNAEAGARYLCELTLRSLRTCQNKRQQEVLEDQLLNDLIMLQAARLYIKSDHKECRTWQDQGTLCLTKATQEIEKMLIKKNKDYGSAVFKKDNVFSKLDRSDAIRVRLDDKISRLANQLHKNELEIQEDTEFDIAGYLILMKVAQVKQETKSTSGT